MLLTADFETTTQADDCRVWAWAVCGINDPSYFQYGNSMDTFIHYMEKSNNSTFYFHNAKFDCEFIIYYLFTHGYRYVEDSKKLATKTFTCLISDKGMFYAMTICFKKQNKNVNKVTIYDSLKIIPFGVDITAKCFGLPISKLTIDYKQYREYGHVLTTEEIAYIRNDVEIMARAIQALFKLGLTEMTQSSNALAEYKRTIGMKNFEMWFPSPSIEMDSLIRQSYKGGYVYLNPLFKEIDLDGVLVLDVNSLYPWVLANKPLPYDNPVYFNGEYQADPIYNLYVQTLTCQFELKEGHLPTIQLKNNPSFVSTQYLTSSGDEEVTLCLTNVDLQLFKEHYHIINPVYHNGYKFKSSSLMFKPYIDKWQKVKQESKLSGNYAYYIISKLLQNGLYGKFSSNPNIQGKHPFLFDGIVKYNLGEKEVRKPLYIPVGTFVTAYAREKTIRSAQMMYDKFIYADTDSLHLKIKLPRELLEMSEKEIENLTTDDLIKMGVDFPIDFDIDPVKLGSWKVEKFGYRARFIRQKCYMEDKNPPNTWGQEEYSTKEIKDYCQLKGLNFEEEIKVFDGCYDVDKLGITCAGMPSSCYQHVTWDNFKVGQSYQGKLVQSHVKGGLVLIDSEYTIQR